MANKIQKSICVAVLLLTAACSREALPTQAAIDTAGDFERALGAAGVSVGRAPESLLKVDSDQAEVWSVSGEEIVVYALDEGADREQVLARLADRDSIFVQQGQALQIWEQEAFVVVYPGADGGVILLINGLLGDARTREVSGPDEPYPPAISAAQHWLADELSVSPAEVIVINYEPAIWPDSCLGLPEDEEICAQAETSGWIIELRANNESYMLRSDAIGSLIRRPD